MPLTDRQVRTLKPEPGREFIRKYDEMGLFIEVRGTGGKLWRLRYRFDGKENSLSLGRYPDVSLAQARERRDEARRLMAQGIDPSVHRKVTKASRAAVQADSFEAVAREWYAGMAPTWAPAHGERIIRRLERDVFPWLGMRPVAELTAPEVLAVLRRTQDRGAMETAHRALQNVGQVFRYAVRCGRAERDPTVDLRGALAPANRKHFPAIVDPVKIGPLLRALDGYHGSLIVRSALRLAPLVFVRPGELRKAQWVDVDLEAAEWRFTASKKGGPHIVPLSRQAVAVLRELQALTGGWAYVFPSARSHERPMSDNAVLMALRALGVSADEMCGHGFRAMARTILEEVLGEPVHLIEHQLSHAVRDPLGRAYNRTQHLPERRRMMQRWADWLDWQRTGAEVIPFPAAAGK